MTLDIIIGLAVIGAIVAIWLVATHHKAPVTPSPKAITDTVTAGLADTWATVKADLPGIVSAEVVRLKALNAQLAEDKVVLQAGWDAAVAKAAVDKKAHEDALAQVAARVSAAVLNSGELSPVPPVAAAPAAPVPEAVGMLGFPATGAT
jgi:hypothetical protein